MILLTTTSEVIKLITADATDIDTHVSAVDKHQSTGAISEYDLDSAITTATTTTICAAPAATTTRNVKFISIVNRDTTSTTVTLQHYNGSIAVDIYPPTVLSPNAAIIYSDGF